MSSMSRPQLRYVLGVPSLFSLLILPLLLFLTCFSAPASAAGSAVLGIDLGTEYIKATLVKPGIPLEIVLTKDSKRKELAAVAFKPAQDSGSPYPERFYGGDALALAGRFPDDVFANLKALLGVPFENGENPTVKTFASRYPALQVERAPTERDAVAIRSQKLGEVEGKDAFLIEELLAMQLKQIKANAEALAGKGSDVRDVVITYPPFYTAVEKESLILAAKMAGLHVESLISDGLAVGLNYATSRTFPSVTDGETPEYHLIYDMGAGSTTATILRFQSRAIKDVGRFNKTIQEIHVLGAGWDRTLGGDSLNELLAEKIVLELVQNLKLKEGTSLEQVRSHGKTMARVWKEAERLRQVLSANSETAATFEGLFDDDITFKYKVTRAEFEKIASDFASRVRVPVDEALAVAGLKIDDLDSVILHGGASRTPFVQKQLEHLCGEKKLRTNVNADEAAVFGAAFKGASLSPSFRVKDIRAIDTAKYAVKVKWSSEGKERSQKLFTPTSQIGVEKEVTVKNLDDFSFGFSQLVLDGAEVIEVPVVNVDTKNLTASVAKLKEQFGCSPVNITTKFSIRLSPIDGLPEVISGSASCEVEDIEKKSSIVDDVKGLFGLGPKKGDQEPLQESEGPSESITLQDDQATPSTASAEKKATSTASKEATKLTSETKAKLEVIPIKLETIPLVGQNVPGLDISRILGRLTAFDVSDHERVLREEALNALEAFIYKGRDLVDDEEFLKALKADQLPILRETLSAISDWLYGDGIDAKRKVFEEKLATLKNIVEPAINRKKENLLRPTRASLLEDLLKNAKSIVELMEKQIQNDEELFSSSLEAAETSGFASSSVASEPTSSETSTTTATTSSASESPSADVDFAGLDDDPYLSTATSSTVSPTKSSSAPSKPASPSYSLFNPADLTSFKRVYESAQAWFDTQKPLQEKLAESDDPAMPLAEIDSQLRALDIAMNRIYTKMGAAASGSESESGGAKSNNKSSSSPKKPKEKGKKNSSRTSATSSSSQSSSPSSSSTKSTSTTSPKDEL